MAFIEMDFASGGGDTSLVYDSELTKITTASVTVPSGVRYANVLLKGYFTTPQSKSSYKMSLNGNAMDWDYFSRTDVSYSTVTSDFSLASSMIKVKEGDVISFDNTVVNVTWATNNIVYYK